MTMNDTELEIRYLREMVTALRRRIAELAPLDPMGEYLTVIKERQTRDVLAERAKVIHWLLGKVNLLRFDSDPGHPWGEKLSMVAKKNGALVAENSHCISRESFVFNGDPAHLRESVVERMCFDLVRLLMEAP